MTQPQVKYRKNYQQPDYTITAISLRFDLDETKTQVIAESQVKRQNPQATTLVLSGEALILKSVLIDGQPWTDYKVTEQGLVLNQIPADFTLTIENEINPAANTALEGLYQSGDALCTQCEAEGFRHITYYLDRPDVLATYRTYICADKARYPYLLSNGNLVEQGELPNGKHWVQWEDPFPKPSYLFALVAGDFDVLKDFFMTRSGRRVELRLFVDKGNLDRAGWAMTSLKNAMKWDETRFGLEYDLDIFMIVAVDFFNMGAMENKGLNVFNAKYVLAKNETATDNDYLNIESVIGHEYFHNWTGNRITCRDWFQLSLKEGLTVFRDQEFSSDMGSRAVNRINAVKVLRGVQFSEDAGPMAHPIRPDHVMEMNNFYTVTVYEKGAEVIRMLHTLLGEEKFQQGMQLYIARHDGSAATCDDFVQAMSDASGIDLTRFKRWYSQSGTPILTVSDEYDVKTQRYQLHVSQVTKPTPDQADKQALHIPLAIELYDGKGQVIPLTYEGQSIPSVLNVIDDKQTFVFDHVPEAPVVSLLREFSAPVKLYYDYSDNELLFLMKHATNDFARWDAAQMLLGKYIKENVRRVQTHETIMLPDNIMNAFKGVLLSEQLDPALMALILTLPSEREMAELFDVIDPDAIHDVYIGLHRLFVQAMGDELLAVYHVNKTPLYQIEHADIAKRHLKNVCLSYLAFGEEEQANQLVTNQYEMSNNMTDMMAALSSAVDANLECSNTLLADFDERWHHDGLVMDKWFMLQSGRDTPDVLSRVQELLEHRSFTLANPNRVRSLIGGFVNNNAHMFHCLDGSGYKFLVEMLTILNERNPQVASRLIEPLMTFKRYDEQRQGLMKAALLKLKSLENLSGDLYEKITRALES